MSNDWLICAKTCDLAAILVTRHIAGGDQEMRSAQSEPTCGVPEGLSTAVSKSQNAEGFAVKRTAQYVEESLDIVQLQTAKAQKNLNLHNETTMCDQVQQSLFRAVVGKQHYITGVRPDPLFVTKNVCHTHSHRQHVQT